MGQDFLWGAAISGYQSEGGYNRPGEPQTNWAEAESRSKVDPVGNASDFLTHYPEDLERCRVLGLNAFRLSIEWSRVQPTLVNAVSTPPDFDSEAILRYARILETCRLKGLEPIVTLHHFVHPAWLGADPWLSIAVIEPFTRFVDRVVTEVNSYLIKRDCEPVRYFITINEPNMLVMSTYLGSQFPSDAPRGVGSAILAISNLLKAHLSAYSQVHEIYKSRGWGPVSLTFNNYTSDIYWLDQFLTDLLMLRDMGVRRSEAIKFLQQRAVSFNQCVDAFSARHMRWFSRGLGIVLRHLAARLGRTALRSEAILSLLEAIYSSPASQMLDLIAFDYYDPFCAHGLRIPRISEWRVGREFPFDGFGSRFLSRWWDWRVLPEGMEFFSELLAANYPGKKLLIAENGMAHRRDVDNAHVQRSDGLLRSDFIRLHAAVIDRLLSQQVPLFGYMHWSLIDNYEWGTYSARFGLFSLDYAKDMERIAEDHYGDRPAETYAGIIRESLQK